MGITRVLPTLRPKLVPIISIQWNLTGSLSLQVILLPGDGAVLETLPLDTII